MADQLISVTGNEILFEAISANSIVDSNGNTFLNIEFLVYSEPEHVEPYSPSEMANKRQIKMTNKGTGLASGVYRVFTSEVKGATRFNVEMEIDSKVPGSGGQYIIEIKKAK